MVFGVSVQGHKSSLAFGFLGKNRVPVVCQLGYAQPAWAGPPVQSRGSLVTPPHG